MNWLHDHGTDRLLSAVNATKPDTVSTPEYKAALARKGTARTSEALASLAMGLTLAAMAKPRPVERDTGDDGVPDQFDNAERREA